MMTPYLFGAVYCAAATVIARIVGSTYETVRDHVKNSPRQHHPSTTHDRQRYR